MDKHTPGPWVVDYRGSIGHIKSVPDGALAGFTPTPTVCRYDAHIRAPSISDEEAGANARLIAAAPEMLAALKELCDLKSLKRQCGETDEYRERQPEAWRAAYAVVAKVLASSDTGETK